jgi:hypothetical protein
VLERRASQCELVLDPADRVRPTQQLGQEGSVALNFFPLTQVVKQPRTGDSPSAVELPHHHHLAIENREVDRLQPFALGDL